jgi:ssDNA-binding Zn-finger/Zn-ribbon topoisomerase 1
MSKTKERGPGDLYDGVDCAKCGETIGPKEEGYKMVRDGFLIACEKCGYEQVYLLSDMKPRQWFPSGD